jgi:LysM repeat protein
MIAGPRFSEATVLALVRTFEQATEFHRRKPPIAADTRCRRSPQPTTAREPTGIQPFPDTPAPSTHVAGRGGDGSGVAVLSGKGGNMGLRDKYSQAILTAKNFRMEGSAEERDGKLYFKGTTQTQEEANQIWDAIKTVPDWSNDIVADIKATGGGAAATAKTYTVQSGDTLSKIAKEHLGDANAYMKIFNANKDQLENPDKIRPGQVLKMPA